jgi:hypothetical protein
VNFKKNIDKLWSAVLKWCGHAAGVLMGIWVWVSIFLMLGCTYVLVAFTATQVAVATKQAPVPVLAGSTRWILSIVGVDTSKVTASDYPDVLSAAVGAVAVLVTLWYSVTTTAAFFRYKKDLQRKALVREEPVYQEGRDDLDAMEKYYRGAESVIVFSGDFSWLNSSHPLVAETDRLCQSRKIKFVSYKTEQDVRAGLGQRFSAYETQFVFDSGIKLKCSLVQKGQRKVLLYVADTTVDSDGAKKVCVISGKDEAQYLLQTIDELCKNYRP